MSCLEDVFILCELSSFCADFACFGRIIQDMFRLIFLSAHGRPTKMPKMTSRNFARTRTRVVVPGVFDGMGLEIPTLRVV
jgi:hypothetical protein